MFQHSFVDTCTRGIRSHELPCHFVDLRRCVFSECIDKDRTELSHHQSERVEWAWQFYLNLGAFTPIGLLLFERPLR